jgi:hypothetical protein
MGQEGLTLDLGMCENHERKEMRTYLIVLDTLEVVSMEKNQKVKK